MNEEYPDRLNNHKRFYSRRKELRNNSTHEERILWYELKHSKLGFKFRRQHSIGGYILDFYCPDKRLVVELDGYHHLTSKEYDMVRDKFLNSFGITVLRFLNTEVIMDIYKVVETIRLFLKSS